MDTELELKLFATGDVLEHITTSLLPSLDAEVKPSQFTLYNQYFDTPSRYLREHDIGFRVRCKNGTFEQTVKTAGKVVGGLHSRPEYNVAIEDRHPDLGLFESHIWPRDCSVADLQKKIEPLFTTDFSRHEFELTFPGKGVVELVVDQGVICADKQKQQINEIELELREGPVSLLFDIADKIVQALPAQIGNFSKAARGYMLAEERLLKGKALDTYLPIDSQTSCESGFIAAVEYALEYWQHHEQCYLQDGKIRHLVNMHNGMQLLLQAIILYLPLLQCEALLDLHKRLMEKVGHWYWLEQLASIKELCSSKGAFRKKLSRNEALLSYLRGVSEGIIQTHNPTQLIHQQDNTLLQLALSRILSEKPWRQESSGFETPILEHAKGWLSQGWHNVMQALPKNKPLSIQEYVAQQVMLRQTLFNGFLLGNLFAEQRDKFRAPWLDILDGIDELKTFTMLQQQLMSADIEDTDALHQWSEEKMHNLLEVMEQSRTVASNSDAYW